MSGFSNTNQFLNKLTSSLWGLRLWVELCLTILHIACIQCVNVGPMNVSMRTAVLFLIQSHSNSQSTSVKSDMRLPPCYLILTFFTCSLSTSFTGSLSFAHFHKLLMLTHQLLQFSLCPAWHFIVFLADMTTNRTGKEIARNKSEQRVLLWIQLYVDVGDSMRQTWTGGLCAVSHRQR